MLLFAALSPSPVGAADGVTVWAGIGRCRFR